jgi:hypothetical protein
MFSNRLAVLAIAALSLAAAGGGYLAGRNNAASVAAPVSHAAETSDMALTPPIEAPLTPALQQAVPPAAPQTFSRSALPPSAPPPARAAAASRPVRREPSASRDVAPAVATAPPVPGLATVPVSPSFPVVSEPIQPEESPFRDLVVPADSVVGLQIETAISSETAAVEDDVDAVVTRDVSVRDAVAIPAGTRALGSVTVVERGGRFREQARLGIRFHTLVLADGSEIPVSTETIYRLGNSPGKATAAKIGGGAVAGAILGGILGGSRGAAIGASSGAGAGTAVVYAGGPSEAVFGSGLEVTARFLSPVTVTVER